MPTVIGFTENRYKKITCWHCAAIIQYEKPNRIGIIKLMKAVKSTDLTARIVING